jgi:hypothetical protein
MNRPWDAYDLRWLRKLYGTCPVADIAELMERTESAVKSASKRLNLGIDRRVTEEQRETIRRLYPTHSAAAVAAATGLSLSAVCQQARKLDLPRKVVPYPATTIEVIGRLHAEDLTDMEIAARLKLERRTVSDIRANRLKLPVNVEALKRARRRGIESQRRTLGIRRGGDLRRYGYRKFAVERGWPADLPPRSVQILELLAGEARPMDRWEIAARIGWNVGRSLRDPQYGQRHLLKANGPGGSYLAILMRAGLVLVLKRALKINSPGKSRNVYMLSPAAIDTVLRRSPCPASTTASSSAKSGPACRIFRSPRSAPPSSRRRYSTASRKPTSPRS